jgi:glycosyltransferase involved in cell wall biosynthesis
MYLNYKKSIDESKSLLWKFIYNIEIPLLYNIEKKHVKKYNITSFVNSQEAIFWERFGNVLTLSHGVEDNLLTYNKYDEKYSNSVTFIGRMDYQPNIDAVLWFCNNVLPLLSKDIKFKVIGGFPTNEIINLQKHNSQIEILGFVEDPKIILRSSICSVAPMRTGGGLQTKVLTSMAVGSLVILSSVAAEAIENAENRYNLFIEDYPINISKLIHDIRNKPSEFYQIRENAKTLIEKNYILSVVNKKLINMIESQIN